MPSPRPLMRLVLAPLAALLLGGCPSLSERGGLPPSVDRAETLERSGDATGAARVYEDLAAQNSGADRNDLLLRAARSYLAAHRADDAARVLGSTDNALPGALATERALLGVELALERGHGQDALRQLAATPRPVAPAAAARYQELQARAAALVSAQGAEPGLETGPHIALLLPITGRATGAAASVRDGFLTAYYQAAPAERPRVRIYDTGLASVAQALQLATSAGADFIVGPLTREEVVAAAESSGAHPPILALNFLPSDHPAPARFYQYALSPEEEARLAARRVLDDHHRHGVAIAPAGDWGTRVLAAFRQELQAGGGDLMATAAIEGGRTDYSAPITDLLRISDSSARWHRLESILGTRLQFEPRRRNDIEFIFTPAPANVERLLRPQLRFHYAGDIPAYATSDAFEPDARANEELEGLMFPDMPWMLGGDLTEAVRAATREAWPSGGPYRGRLFAFGFDAFRLAQALRRAGAAGNVSVEGLTGRLTLDAERRVQRAIGWGQLHNGEVKLLPAATQ